MKKSRASSNSAGIAWMLAVTALFSISAGSPPWVSNLQVLLYFHLKFFEFGPQFS
jgi:hypothetical protein